jgi:hypothetical protein
MYAVIGSSEKASNLLVEACEWFQVGVSHYPLVVLPDRLSVAVIACRSFFTGLASFHFSKREKKSLS